MVETIVTKQWKETWARANSEGIVACIFAYNMLPPKVEVQAGLTVEEQAGPGLITCSRQHLGDVGSCYTC